MVAAEVRVRSATKAGRARWTLTSAVREAARQILPERRPPAKYVPPSEYVVDKGRVYWSDGMDEDYEPNLFMRLFAAITLGLYIGVPYVILALAIGSFWYPLARAALALILGTAFLPLRPLFVRRVMASYVFFAWRRYFKFSYVFDQSLDPYQDYVIAQYPHGAFPLGCLLSGTFMATQYPEYTCYALAAHNSFLVPIWRHVHTWMGTMAATEKNFRRLLALGTCKGLRAAAERAAAARGEDAAAAGDAAAAAAAETAAGGNAAAAARARRAAAAPSSDGGGRYSHDDSTTGSLSSPSSEASDSPKSASDGDVGRGAAAATALLARAAASPAAAAAAGAAAPTTTGAAAVSAAEHHGGGGSGRRSRLRKRNPQGVSVAVMVGGIAEMYLQHPDFERIKLMDRKGFIRIAIEHGASVLPVYNFGVSQMMSFGPPWLMDAARRLRMSIGVMYGVMGTTIPRRVPLRMAVGEPIDVGPAIQRGEPGFEERVEQVHAAYVEGIKKVYYTHREAYGWGDRPLVIT